MQSKIRKEETLRLDRIGQTRWSSRGRALSKLFGSYTNLSSKFHSVLLIILQQVSKIYGLKGSVCYEAQKLSENLRKLYVCMYLYFSAATAQIKHKRALKVDKKEAVKNVTRYRTYKQYIVQI